MSESREPYEAPSDTASTAVANLVASQGTPALTAKHLARLRKLASKAAPGPWRWVKPPTKDGWGHAGPDLLGANDAFVLESRGYDADWISVSRTDAAYIAAASPDVIVALLDRLEEAEAMLARNQREIVASPQRCRFLCRR